MSKGLILITGVNGFIAAVVAKHFLEEGYSVRGTVRRLKAATALTEGPLKQYTDARKFEVVEVPDITVEGAFDEAVKDVTAIAHLASPVSFGFKDPAPILHAAVNGTKAILNSSLKAGPQLKTFVVMSSIASIKSQPEPPYAFTEKDWNDWAEEACEKQGKETPGPVIYSASKVAAEKAFWAFGKDKKPGFTMTAINPVFVIGPPLIHPKTASEVGETIRSIWTIFSGAPHPPPMSLLPQVVDVRDVAQLLLYPIEHTEETNDERYIASAALSHPQAIADILRRVYSDAKGRIVEGTPGKGYSKDYQEIEGQGGFSVDSSKAKKLLEDGEWIGFEKSVIDTAKTFQALL